jgi:hypothetical protein
MKSNKFTFDFSDQSQLAELIRLEAATSGKSQKAIIIEALQSYFAHRQENLLLLRMAEKSFDEWNSEEDAVYDTL